MRDNEETAVCEVCDSAIPVSSPDGMCPHCLLDPGIFELLIDGGNPADEGEDAFGLLPSSDSDSIGPYRVRELIAEGGMGRIYAAKQRHPIEREVALKVIKPGMGSGEVVARFEAERQALALMNHPHIASVFDAGTTDSGLPYFAMEFVDGASVTKFCASENLSIEDRLRLFRKICDAVQHAHQKGIIHRDLKPSNILVSRDEDGNPSPKIIDFGIAKALGADPSEAGAFTLLGHLVGTPQYMSPEQASFDAEKVDTRSDIYSLGVLLYELLVGKTPLGKGGETRESSHSTLQRLRGEEAPKAVHRFQALPDDEQEKIALERGTTPAKLASFLSKDLNFILAKALELEPSHRYESASSFSRDVERFLNGEPVLACNVTARYRLSKFARKNKALIAGSAAVAASMVIGIVTTAWQAKVAREEERKALAAKASAEDLVEFMLSDLRGRLSRLGKLEVMAGVEDAVRNYYESSRPGEIGVAADRRRARALTMSAQTLERQGRLEDALVATRQALAIRQSRWESESDQSDALDELAESLLRESWLLRQLGDVEGTEQSLLALEELSQSREAESASGKAQIVFAEALRRRASDLLVRFGAREQAETCAKEALRIALKAREEMSESDDVMRTVALAISTAEEIGVDVSDLWNRFPNPGSFYDIMGEILSSSPEDYTQKADLLEILAQPNYADVDQERLDLGLTLAKELTSHDPGNIEWQILAASMEARAAYTHLEAYRASDARPYFESADSRYSNIIEASEASDRVMRAHAELLSRMSYSLRKPHSDLAAIQCQNRALEALRELLARNPEDADIMYLVSTSLLRLAKLGNREVENRLRILDEAYSYAEKAYGQMDNTGQSDGAVYYVALALADELLEKGDVESAAHYGKTALAVAEGISSTHEIGALECNAKIAVAAGDISQAAALYRRSSEVWRDHIEKGDVRLEWGTYGGRYARTLTNLLSHESKVDADLVSFARDSLSIIRGEILASDTRIDGFRGNMRSVVKLADRLAKEAYDLELADVVRESLDTLAVVSLHGARRIEDNPSERFEFLTRLAAHLDEWESVAGDFGHSTWIREEIAEEILTEWRREPFATLRAAEDSEELDRLPWIACRSRIRGSIEQGELEQAMVWIERAHQLLSERWKESAEVGVFSLAVVHSLLELVEFADEVNAPDWEDYRDLVLVWGASLPEQNVNIRKGKAESAIVTLGRLVQLGDNSSRVDEKRAILDWSLELLEGWPTTVVDRFSANGKRQAALVWERHAFNASGREDWVKAESYLRSGLRVVDPRWSSSLRLKAQLVFVHHESGRGLDEESVRMRENVIAALEPMESANELSGPLRQALEKIRKTMPVEDARLVEIER